MTINFPEIPECKTKIVKNELTLEQIAIFKLIQKEDLNSEELIALNDAIEFYKICFPFFQSLKLSEIDDIAAEEIKSYLNKVIDFQMIIQNDISFHSLWRITKVSNSFLQDGKVRDIKYITNPTSDVLRKIGKYNRASSPNLPIFYASFHESVALHEFKPEIGDRIIISRWENFTKKSFVSFPIVYYKNIHNKMSYRNNSLIAEMRKQGHPLLAEIMSLYLAFLSEEFVKKIEIVNSKRYEYLFSSYFGDSLLDRNLPISDIIKPNNPPDKPMKEDFDCIVYPSVAFNHQEDNLAISPISVSKNLRPASIEDCIVEDTFFDSSTTVESYPIKKKVLRKAIGSAFGKFIWNDDIQK